MLRASPAIVGRVGDARASVSGAEAELVGGAVRRVQRAGDPVSDRRSGGVRAAAAAFAPSSAASVAALGDGDDRGCVGVGAGVDIVLYSV